MPVPEPPLLDEPLAIELANTRFVVRGRERDGLEAPADLAAWLRRIGHRRPDDLTERDLRAVGPHHLAAARGLRDAIRTLLAATVADAPSDPGAVELVNRMVRDAPQWQELAIQPRPGIRVRTAAEPVTAVLAAIAADAVHLLGGPRADALRACSAPDCILYFEKDHPRRTCCSTRCSNRVRAARHYARRTGAGRPSAP